MSSNCSVVDGACNCCTSSMGSVFIVDLVWSKSPFLTYSILASHWKLINCTYHVCEIFLLNTAKCFDCILNSDTDKVFVICSWFGWGDWALPCFSIISLVCSSLWLVEALAMAFFSKFPPRRGESSNYVQPVKAYIIWCRYRVCVCVLTLQKQH